MNDLINREDAIDSIMSLCIDGEEYREYNHGLYAARTILDGVLPAEKTGKWKRISGQRYTQSALFYYACSECDGKILGKYNYCPNCGAKMVNDEVIQNVPITEKTGKWIFNTCDGIEAMFAKPKCSVCGFESADGLNYCPNCGARMVNDNE